MQYISATEQLRTPRLKNFSGALSDGKEVVRLRPQWAKGWARIAAAQFGLEGIFRR